MGTRRLALSALVKARYSELQATYSSRCVFCNFPDSAVESNIECGIIIEGWSVGGYVPTRICLIGPMPKGGGQSPFFIS